MKIEQNSEISIHTHFLLCSIFTLEPNNHSFKKINLSHNFSFTATVNNKKSLVTTLYNEKHIKDYHNLLNRSSIRQIAYTLLKPILSQPKTVKGKLKIYPSDVTILKQYLKKYKYFYTRYFSAQPNGNGTLNDKELNYFAMHSLFLILGV